MDYNRSLIIRKPVFGLCDQGRLKPACAATETRYRLENLTIASISITLARQQKQRRSSDCADAQADLRLCCSHMAKAGFLMTWLIVA